MKNYKKVVSLALSSLMLAGSVSVMAETGDIYKKDGSLYKTRKEVGTNKLEQKKIAVGAPNFLYESSNGALYTFADANSAYKAAEDKSQFTKELEKNYTPISTDLTVDSVSAIDNTTIKVIFTDKEGQKKEQQFKVAPLQNGSNTREIEFLGKKYNVVVNYTDQNEQGLEIVLTPSKTEVQVSPNSANEPVEIAVDVKKLPADTEATLAFTSTWGQIVKQETTTNGKVNVKLYPQEDSEVKEAKITATILAVKNVKTGEILDYKNTTPGETKVTFIPSGAGQDEGSVFQITGGLTDQADRVYVNLNKQISDSLVAKLNSNPGSVKVYNNIKDNGDNNPIPVKSVLRKDGDTLVLVLNENSANFPLIDNAKHKVVFDYNGAELVYVKGEADFFLEDSNYIKMIKVQTNLDDSKLDYNQLRVIFNEAVNNASQGSQGFEYSVQDKSNWVIDGLNLAHNLPSGNPNNVDIRVDSVKKDTEERESVVLTFNDSKDLQEFLYNKDASKHKLQVNNVGDWASVTDISNIVATQELEYNNLSIGTPEAQLSTDSPEQFVVKFTAPTKCTLADVRDAFTLVVPDKSKKVEDPYSVANRKFGLTHANGNINVEQLSNNTYLIELNKDWTQLFDTETTYANYHDDFYKDVRVDINGFTNLVGDKLETVVGTGILSTNIVTLIEDVESPFIVKNTQLTKDLGVIEGREINRKAGAMKLDFNEPIQFVDQDGNKMSSTETPSQQQASKNGVPTLTFEYVQLTDENGKAVTSLKTVEGRVAALDNLEDKHASRDFSSIIEPVKELTVGTWKLVVRSVSDDVGNTLATKEINLEIINTTTGPVEQALKLVQVDAHHTVVKDTFAGVYTDRTWLKEYAGGADLEKTNDARDIIHIVFNQDVALVGDDSVLNKNNYRLNGESLPVDGTRIERGILGEPGKETVKSAVTIVLPDGYLQEKDKEHILTIMNVKDATGKYTLNEKVQIREEAQVHSTAQNGVLGSKAAMHGAAVVSPVESVKADLAKLLAADVTAANLADVKTQLAALETAYDKLTAEEKAQVTNYAATVKAVEDKIAELEAQTGEDKPVATIEVTDAGVLPGKDKVLVTLTGVANVADYEISFGTTVFVLKDGKFVGVVNKGTTADQLKITKVDKPVATIEVTDAGVLPGKDKVLVTLTGVSNVADYEISFGTTVFVLKDGKFIGVVNKGTTADQLKITKK